MASGLLRPLYVVSKKEFRTNLLSVRMIILVSILALIVIGISYGFAGLSAITLSREQFVVWVHETVQDTELGVTAFVSDAWGDPYPGTEVEVWRQDPDSGLRRLVDSGTTDSDGFARFPLDEGFYSVSAAIGIITWEKGAFLNRSFLYDNLSYDFDTFDRDDSGFLDDLAVHFLDITGAFPDGVRVFLEGEEVEGPDARGFLALKLPNEGDNNLTFVYGQEIHELTVKVFENPASFNPFAEGPDFVLFLIAMSFGGFLLPIVAIALSYDSISKEKVQGSADLLLYRPASWRSIAVGKFLGTFTAIALPVAAVNLVAAMIIAAVTGIMPSTPVILGFIGFSLFLLAVYILLMQTLSSFAKTAGTAMIFGVILWFTYAVLWSAVSLLVGAAAGIPFGSREYIVLGSYTGLFNPNNIYSNLFVLVAPEGFETLGGLAGISGGLIVFPDWVHAVSAVVWIVVLFILFLEVFKRKAAG